MNAIRKAAYYQCRASLLGRPTVYSQCYDSRKFIYIHIPKAAGTSICSALYGLDPWHYSASELRWISPLKYRRYKKAAFVRHPISRIVSTYNYAVKRVVTHPQTSIAFMAQAKSLNDFVENWLTADLVKKHYFFWTQNRYLSLPVDFIGKFENLQADYDRMCAQFGFSASLPYENASATAAIEPLSDKAVDNIVQLYRADFDRFGYTVAK